MALIADHLNINAARIRAIPDGLVLPGIAGLGFEVELEGGDGNWPQIEGWQTTDDGSLRGNRIEYIFAGPQGGLTAEASLLAFEEAMKVYQPQPTFRCSTHVHMDVRLLNWNQYEKTVLAYMVFEDSFFDQQDRYRRNSNFCIPFMNNDWFSSQFGRRVIAMNSEMHKFDGVARWTKYSALNLNVTAQHGSIEFRGSEALVTVEKLQSLALRMLSIRKMATDHADLSHLEFINMLLDANIQDVFLPGSFPLDYVMEPGSREQGYGSALNSVTQADLENNDGERQRMREEAERVRQEQARDQEERQRLRSLMRGAIYFEVMYNMEAFRAANINTPLYDRTLAGVMNSVIALRAVGVPVNVRDMFVHTNNSLRALRTLRDNIESLHREWGYTNITAEMLA